MADESSASSLSSSGGCFFAVVFMAIGGILFAWAMWLQVNDDRPTPNESELMAIGFMAEIIGDYGDSLSNPQEPEAPPGESSAVVVDEAEAPEEPAPLPPIASSEEWQFTEAEGQMDCDGGLAIAIPPSGTSSVDMALLEDGRLLFSGVGDGSGKVLAELDEDAPDANTYVGTLVPQDGTEGINLVFTITFKDDGTATTHIGGYLVSEAGRCSIDRPGEATITP